MSSGPNSTKMTAAPHAPPEPKKIIARPVVKIVLPVPGGDVGSALIYSRDRSVVMSAAPGTVSKRFTPGELVGYFKSELDEDGILEIGDRVPAPGDRW